MSIPHSEQSPFCFPNLKPYIQRALLHFFLMSLFVLQAREGKDAAFHDASCVTAAEQSRGQG